MSLIGAFNNGVGGLLTASEAFGAITQNLTNSRTPGYRQLDTLFSTLLGGVTTSGQPGGVTSQVRTIMDVQGPLENTNRTFDIAISGPGMFVFGPFEGGSAEGDDLLYSRAGNLITIRTPDNQAVGYLGNETGNYLLGWRLVNGQVVSNSLADLVPIPGTTDDAFPGQATTNGELVATLPASGTSAATQVFYFDQAGDKHSIWLDFTKTGANQWDLQATDLDGNPVGGINQITFDGHGRVASSETVNIAGLFDLDVSNLTQIGSQFQMGKYIQDGIARGEFVAYSILQDGTVNGRYTSGAVRALFKIPVATFINQAALEEVSGTMYRVTERSGGPTLHEAGGDNIQITSGAIEMPNFDLADGFTKLIVMQRAYDMSSKVVQTVDEMSEVARDMKR